MESELSNAKCEVERLTLDKEALARIADTSEKDEQIKVLEDDLLHYKGLLENERRSRQSVSDNINRKDLHLEDLERVNFELSNQLDLKNSIIRKNEEELNRLKFQIRD